MKFGKWNQVGPRKMMDCFGKLDNPTTCLDYYDIDVNLKDANHIYHRKVSARKNLKKLLKEINVPFVRMDNENAKEIVVDEFLVYKKFISGEPLLVGKYIYWNRRESKHLQELFSCFNNEKYECFYNLRHVLIML